MEFWDYRHPAKQLANRYLAAYRDKYPTTPNLPALEYTVNKIIEEISELGYTVFADGTRSPVNSVKLAYKVVGDSEVLDVQCN